MNIIWFIDLHLKAWIWLVSVPLLVMLLGLLSVLQHLLKQPKLRHWESMLKNATHQAKDENHNGFTKAHGHTAASHDFPA